jgi:release factor glutamine methyltransferase
MTDIASILKRAVAEGAGGLDRIDAEFLLAHCLDKPRSWLYAHDDQVLDAQHCSVFEVLVQRRKQGEPVAYITGRRAFWSMDLNVTPDTLIPRPETELLVELALSRVDPESRAEILDLGTGSGAVALAIAVERPACRITAVDVSAEALAVAAANAGQLNLCNVVLEHGDWYSLLDARRFGIIVSNPPYIESSDAHLAIGDLRFEPHSALVSGPDGLDDIRTIIAGAHRHLLPGGWLLLEHGWHQGEAIRGLFAQAGFTDVETVRDLEQRDRVTMGRMR